MTLLHLTRLQRAQRYAEITQDQSFLCVPLRPLRLGILISPALIPRNTSSQDRLGRRVAAVIDRRLQPENFRYNVVDIHVLERLDHYSLFESRPVSDEEPPHGFELVVVTMLSTIANGAVRRRLRRPVTLPAGHQPALLRDNDDVAYPPALAVVETRR